MGLEEIADSRIHVYVLMVKRKQENFPHSASCVRRNKNNISRSNAHFFILELHTSLPLRHSHRLWKVMTQLGRCRPKDDDFGKTKVFGKRRGENCEKDCDREKESARDRARERREEERERERETARHRER